MDVVQLGAERARRAPNEADAVSPRDMLLALVADMDEGTVKPTAMIVIIGEMDEGDWAVGFRQSSPDPLISLGMLTRTIWRINDPEG